MMLLQLLSASIFIACTESACNFPSDLRGYQWYTTSNGLITIPRDGATIQSFRSEITSATTLTLTCSDYDSSGDRYISTVTFTVFVSNEDRKAFFCMKFTQLSTKKFVMTYQTDIESTTLTRVVVINDVAGTLTTSEACALTSDLPVGTQELWIRSDSVSESTITCPSSLQATLRASIESESCTDNTIEGATTSTQHTYTYQSCVTKKYSTAGVFDCVYSVEEDPHTYLTVFNKDTTTVDESTTYRYLCYVIWSSGHMVYYTYHPKICQTSQTSTVPSTDGVAVVAFNDGKSSDAASQIAVGVIFSLFLIIVIVVAIILLVKYLKPELCTEKSQTTQLTSAKKKSTSKSKSTAKAKQGKKRKKKKNKVTEKIAVNPLFTVRRTNSMKDQQKRLKWSEVVGISSNADEFKKPEWQVTWEQHEDPIWGKEIITDDPDTARSIDSVRSANSIIMTMPEREEQNRANNLWEKVYRLWFEPRKPLPENRLEMQKLAKLAQPKHVRFKGGDKVK